MAADFEIRLITAGDGNGALPEVCLYRGPERMGVPVSVDLNSEKACDLQGALWNTKFGISLSEARDWFGFIRRDSTEPAADVKSEDWITPYSELWTAHQMFKLRGADIRYSQGFGWLLWDGSRWTRDALAGVEGAYQETVREFYLSTADLPGKARELAAKHLWHCEQHRMMKAVLGWLQVLPGVHVRDSDMEAKPMLFNFRNGTLDLETGRLRPHRREDMLLKRSDVTYDEHAACPRFMAFLDDIFAGDDDLIGFAQRALGTCMMGRVRHHVLHILFGAGANGKSTLTEAVLSAFGEYGLTAAPKLLVKKRNETHTTDLAQLLGARLVVCAETGAGAKLDEERVKWLTGGDRICARFMRQDNIQFEPTHSLLLFTNHRPVITNRDLGIWRRLRLWPFKVTIPDDKQDLELIDKLRMELPGIAAWLASGCMQAQVDGLGDPESVRVATAEYRQSEDLIAQFVEDECIESPTATIPKGELYRAFVEWSAERFPMSKKAFGLALEDRSYDETKLTIGGRRQRVWIGIERNTGEPDLLGQAASESGTQ